MPPDVDVLIPGRPTVDFVFAGLERWPELGREVYADDLLVAAGAHFNTAAAFARLGLRVAFVGVVGDDPLGELVLRDLRAEGMDERFVRVAPEVPTPLSVALNLRGDRGFVTYEPAHETAERLFVAAAEELLRAGGVRHVHGDLSATRRLLPSVRAAGATVSVDAHDAGPWLSSRAVRELVAAVDVLFVNEHEAVGMTGAASAEASAVELAGWAPHVVVKRGRVGATAFVGRERVDGPTTPVEVVDATGAGDCFAAGYLWGWLRGEPPRTCLAYGNVCGAAAVTVLGGYRGAPTAAELLAATGDPAPLD